MSLHESIERRKSSAAGAQCAVPVESAAMLELVTWRGARWAFPWSHLASAKFAGTDDADELSLVFTTHRVLVKGANLSGLWKDVVGLRLGLLCELPEKYRSKQEGDAGFVSLIEVSPSNLAVADLHSRNS